MLDHFIGFFMMALVVSAMMVWIYDDKDWRM